MRTKIRYIISIVLSLAIGASGMYAFYYFMPKAVNAIKENKSVIIEENTSLAEPVNNVYNSVVLVKVQTSRSTGFGSGFVYKTDDKYAYILTNHHVIDSAKKVVVEFMDDTEINATVIGSDEYADVAVLKVEKPRDLVVATMGKSEETRLGDTIFTIGTPVDIEYKGTVTRGIISGKDRLVAVAVKSSYVDDYIMQVLQIDASINSGNSGGPLCNAKGEVIGMNTMKIASSTTENIGFAIPIEDALKYAEDILKNGKIDRPYIGIGMYDLNSAKYYGLKIDVSDDVEGIYIAEVTKKGPAEVAGMQKGDILTKIGAYEVSSVSEFRYYLYKFNVGDKVNFQIIRNNKSKTITLTLGEN